MHDREGADPLFGVVLITGGSETGESPEVARIGTAASIIAERPYDDGRYDLVVRGNRRFRILDQHLSRPYLVGSITWLEEADRDLTDHTLAPRVWQSFIALANAYLEQTRQIGVEPMRFASRDRDMPSGLEPSALGYLLASRLPVAAADRQELLEASSTDQLFALLLRILSRERRLVSRIGATIVVAGHNATQPASDP
jgi:Lon protease-like protein